MSEELRSTDVAVVICAYTEDRWEDILAAVASVQSQTDPVGEIALVIDHNEALLTRALGHFSPGVNVVANRHGRGLSGARNTGIELTSAPLIAFLDDDAVAEPQWISAMLRCYGDPRVLGVGGKVAPLWSTSPPRWWPAEFDWVVGCSYTGLPSTVAPIRNPIGANMSARRAVFDIAGGFNPAIGRVGKHPIGCEETELFIRARKQFPDAAVLYCPQSTVGHKVPSSRATFKYFRARCYAEGLSKAVVARLAGPKDALSSERSYTAKVLPLGVLRGVGTAIRGDLAGLGRAAAIVAGLGFTTAGYLRGKAGTGVRLNVPESSLSPASGIAET